MADLMSDNNDDFQRTRSNHSRLPTKLCATLIGGALSIAQITVGAVFLYECPVVPVIPVYVLVSGVVTLVVVTSWGLPWLQTDKSGPGSQVDYWKFLISILAIFQFFWFIIGSVPLYNMFPPNYDKNLTVSIYYNFTQSNYSHIPSKLTNELNLSVEKENETLSNLSQLSQNGTANYNQTTRNLPYCDQTLYLFAFSTTTLVYISFPLLVIVYGCVLKNKSLSKPLLE